MMIGTLTEPLGWFIIEQASAVVSACLPTLRPLLVRVHQLTGPLLQKCPASKDGQQWNSELVTIGRLSGRDTKDRRFLRLTSEEGLDLSANVSTTICHENPYEAGSEFHMLAGSTGGIDVQVRRSIERSSADVYFRGTNDGENSAI